MLNKAKQGTEPRRPKKSLLRNILLLFGALITAIVGNALYSAYQASKEAIRHLEIDQQSKLKTIVSIHNNELQKLNIVSSIVKEQNQKYCDFIDYDNLVAITFMLKRLVNIHDIDLAFVFNENDELLTTCPKGPKVNDAHIYGQLIGNAQQYVGLGRLPRPILMEQLPAFQPRVSEDSILCFTSVIPLVHDTGDIYGHVVLVKLIIGNQSLAQQMAAIAKAEIVYYGVNGITCLTSLGQSQIPFPQNNLLRVDGRSYFTASEPLSDFQGKPMGMLALLIDKNPFLAQRRQLIVNSLLPVFLSAIISIVLFILLKIRVFDKINQLIIALRRVGKDEGDLGVRLLIPLKRRESGHSDELDFMAMDFNSMMERLEDTYKAMVEARKGIETANRKLEKRVDERTIQLTQTNEELIQEIEERRRAEKERAELEIQLQRAQKMEAIGTLAGCVAHDLNNILSGLVGYPELLLTDLPEDSYLRKPIELIYKSGKKAAAIVQDLLTLARRGVAITEVVNLNNIISEYLKSPEHQKLIAYHSNVSLEVNLNADLLNMQGSSLHLSKTIMNLVSNALEATNNGGKAVITTENCYIDNTLKGYEHISEGDYITLTVADTGVGIAPEDKDRIFDPFYTKKKMGRSGTGLGMAVVWGTVKDHQGYIDVKSVEGHGTTFTLYFPVTRIEITEADKPVTQEDYMGQSETILVIDDVAEQRELALIMLERLGYSVTAVESGEKAVEHLKTNTVDVLIMDMIMDPGMDGLETYKQILDLHPRQKAVIASGFSENQRVKEVQRLGAGVYVKKPYTLEKIGMAVRKELGRSQILAR